MLNLARKLSQSSTTSNTFSVFEDSQDDINVFDKQTVEVQTDEKGFADSCENTSISIPFDLDVQNDHELAYWAAVAKLKMDELRKVQYDNEQIEQKIQHNITLKSEKLEEYEKLFTVAASVLENEEEDTETNS